MSKSFTKKEVGEHKTEDSGIYIIVDDGVYDVTNFIEEHPGGSKILKRMAGKDSTKQFWKYHGKNVLEKYGPKLKIGSVKEEAKLIRYSLFMKGLHIVNPDLENLIRRKRFGIDRGRQDWGCLSKTWGWERMANVSKVKRSSVFLIGREAGQARARARERIPVAMRNQPSVSSPDDSPNSKMPAINTAIVARDSFSSIAKRQNWAAKEAGVVVVFCIVFVVAVGLIGLFIHKKVAARKARKAGA
ncbi:putative Cytochrome b5 [Seiridium unicorne]|uniref:Cytochrome b5 n=1 Tax=Seiridium unicorne TaxID=138068 RepID=A0ABR2UTF9_9PEZI